MLCHAMSCYVMLCHVMPCYVMFALCCSPVGISNSTADALISSAGTIGHVRMYLAGFSKSPTAWKLLKQQSSPAMYAWTIYSCHACMVHTQQATQDLGVHRSVRPTLLSSELVSFSASFIGSVKCCQSVSERHWNSAKFFMAALCKEPGNWNTASESKYKTLFR